jgi:hypothetical protein
MRTSAQKISSLYAWNEKEISLTSDRAQSSRNFAPIARSRTSALEAVVRDRKFSRRVAIFSHDRRARTNFFSRSKKNFRSRGILKESQ